MRDTVKRWPSSRFAHEGLANALLAADGGQHGAQGSATKEAAASELLAAAELALAEGQLRYQLQLAQLLADVGDRQGLDRFFTPALKLATDRTDRYVTCLAYADALARFADARADEQFGCAIENRADGIFAPYELYADHLLELRRYQDVLDLLTPAVIERAEMLRGLFFDMRCRALVGLGHDASRERDCQQAEEASPRPGRSTNGATAPDDTSGGLSGFAKVHSNAGDDCRSQTGCAYHPSDTTHRFWCYKYHTWNMAEVMTNEALGESPGSQAAVAWTERDRYTRLSTPACGAFPGSNLNCTSICPNPGITQMCQTQIRSCCTSHSGQFVDTHVVPSFEILERARRVIDGELVDPVSGYVPTGANGCVLNSCDGTAYCNSFGSSYTFAPDGPVYFYGNSATGFRCYGYQPGISTACAIVADETCGNSANGSASDNCYLRATRERLWNSGFTCISNCWWNGDLSITAGGSMTKTPTETPPFRKGGMAVVVRAGLYATGPGTVIRIRAIDPSGGVVYDFGTLPVTSTAYNEHEFRSTVVVDGTTVNRIWLTNEGGARISVTWLKMRD